MSAVQQISQPLQVLIVDDSHTMRYSLRTILEAGGHIVTDRENGQTALETARQGQFDIVITDVNMPVMDGIQFTRELRKIPDYKYISVLFLTTETDQQMRNKGRDAGATGWIVKPFTQEKINAAFERCSR